MFPKCCSTATDKQEDVRMPRSLIEIASDIEQAQEALLLLAQAASGPSGKLSVFDRSGNPIDLLALANELREHAAAESN